MANILIKIFNRNPDLAKNTTQFQQKTKNTPWKSKNLLIFKNSHKKANPPRRFFHAQHVTKIANLAWNSHLWQHWLLSTPIGSYSIVEQLSLWSFGPAFIFCFYFEKVAVVPEVHGGENQNLLKKYYKVALNYHLSQCRRFLHWLNY